MDFFANNILLIMFLPVWISLIIFASVIFKMSGNRKMTVFLTLISTFTGLLFSLGAFNYVRIPNTLVIEKNLLWLSFENLNLYLGTLIDSASTTFLVLLMFISFLVQLYSYGYMKDKAEFSKYYIYLNFFNFSMIGLILASNLFQMYIFWELTGIFSYLLIGFFHKQKDVSDSAKRVFIINKAGDISFLAGVILFLYISITYLNQTNAEILSFTDMNTINSRMSLAAYPFMYDAACLLTIIGGFIKSAQFPMHLWLTDAMKAPSPVSALIHSATMVAMGVYLVIRIYPLLTPELFNIILLTGMTTAFLCAFIALTQSDLKKMLAYSTSSQLGFIFAALGLFSIPTAIIYLVIHSFTKALLFLCAGVIEKTYNGLQDMTKMGNLRKIDINIAIYWIIGALSLSGIFFGGFTSKEMLIKLAHTSNNTTILFIILLTSYFTAFYISRAYFLIFENNTNEAEPNSFSLKTEKTMTASIMILCIFVIFPGFIFKLNDINYLCLISVLIGILAIINAFYSNKCKNISLPKAIYKLSFNELYIPKIYDYIQILFSNLFKITVITEKYIFDKIPVCISKYIKKSSDFISLLQNGNIQSYITYSILSICVIFCIILSVYFVMAEV